MPRGDKVVLRAIEHDDLPVLNAWWNDPELWHLLGERAQVTSLAEAELWYEAEIAKSGPEEGRTYAMASAEDGRLLGAARHGPFDHPHRHCELSIYVAGAGDRNRGFGTAAMRLLLAYLFGDLGLNKVRLLVHPENAPALRCYERLGFVREGLLRQHRFYGGRFHDFISMGLLAAEWKGE